MGQIGGTHPANSRVPGPPASIIRGTVGAASLKHRELEARVWPVWKKAEAMHTRMVQIVNGPGQARAVLWSWSPGIRGHGIGTVPTLITWRCYPTADRASSKKGAPEREAYPVLDNLHCPTQVR
jgi:hypothetical protein